MKKTIAYKIGVVGGTIVVSATAAAVVIGFLLLFAVALTLCTNSEGLGALTAFGLPDLGLLEALGIVFASRLLFGASFPFARKPKADS